ncbi:EamA family transporter [Microlunatus aurantiacus]|uniref:EamA family transporter n=1 Tax=Microlunatus aurantiacus TaxID=446786 RepID=A0ABP7CXG0_9ACTN
MTRRGWLLFVTLSLCWGIPYLFIRIAVTELDPVVVAFGRTALGALLLLPFALRSKALVPLRAHWRWLLIYTVLEIVGPWVLLGHAETRLSSSTTGLLIAMVPIVAAVIVTVTGQDRLGPRRVAGLLIGLGGVALLVGLDVHADDLVAILQILGVVIGYAIGPIIISRQLADLPPLGVITASLLIAAVVYAPFAVVLRPATVSPAAIGSVVVLAVICTAVAFLVMFALIAEAGPARMTLITYVNPAVAIGLGALVLDEPITTGLLLGFPLIIVGSILGTWRSAPPEATGLDPQVVGTPRRDPL